MPTPEFWLILIFSLVAADFVFDKVLDFLNVSNWKDKIPDELKEHYDHEKYLKARAYQLENGRLSLISSSVSVVLILLMILLGGFGWLDGFISVYTDSAFLRSGLFFMVLMLASQLIGLPFSIYRTFVIEEKFGFNRTTPMTFVMDRLKGYLLGISIGGGLLWLALFLIEQMGNGFWFWLWLALAGFSLLMSMLYADVILPLFNKLEPLEDGELRSAINEYATKVGYNLKNIFVMNGSKRSSKGNAFFSGLGPRKTIALYDTLIEKHTTEELVAILAHEVGHFKKKHVLVGTALSVLQIGFLAFLFEQFISIDEISIALGGTTSCFHLGLIGFGIVLSPLTTITGILMTMLSRKNEFAADSFAKETYAPKPLIESLKKLSVDNLSNLHPHPLYVFVHYSHPPLLKRLEALKG